MKIDADKKVRKLLLDENERLRKALEGYVDFKVCARCGNGEMCEDCNERYMSLHDEAYKALGRVPADDR